MMMASYASGSLMRCCCAVKMRRSASARSASSSPSSAYWFSIGSLLARNRQQIPPQLFQVLLRLLDLAPGLADCLLGLALHLHERRVGLVYAQRSLGQIVPQRVSRPDQRVIVRLCLHGLA